MSYKYCRGRVPTSRLGSWDLSRTPVPPPCQMPERPSGRRHCVSEKSLRMLLDPLQSGPAHAAWEDRELGLVAVGVGAGVAYADIEHH